MKKLLLFFTLISSFLSAVPNGAVCDSPNYWELTSHYGPTEPAGHSYDPYSWAVDGEVLINATSYKANFYTMPTHVESGYTVYQYTEESYTYVCSPEIVCDNNQTIDTSVNPHVCIDNPTPPEPLQCPANALPDATNTFCVCNPPYVLTNVDGNNTCVIPSPHTAPDGDFDGDGIPNVDDTDDDNDGYSDNQEITDGTDLYDGNSNGSASGGGTSTGGTTAPDGGGSNASIDGSNTTPRCTASNKWFCSVCLCPSNTIPHFNSFLDSNGVYQSGICPTNTKTYCDSDTGGSSCNKSILGEYEHYEGVDCLRVCDDGYEYNSIHICSPIDNNTNDCSHAPVHDGYPFQTFTDSITTCRNIISNLNTRGSFLSRPDCDLGRVACYYDATVPTTDSNSTLPDSNSTGFDDSRIVNRLDTTNSKLDFINGAIDEQTTKLSDKLEQLDRNNLKSSNAVKTSIDNMNGSLSGKLDAITNAINNKPVSSGTDMTATNNHLQSIEDKMIKEDSELPFDNSELESKFEEAKTVFNNALVTFQTSYNDIKSLFNGAHSSPVTASGNCFLNGSTKNIGSYTFDFSSLSTLRPPFQFFLNLFLLFFTIKLYSRIARDLMQYMIGA